MKEAEIRSRQESTASYNIQYTIRPSFRRYEFGSVRRQQAPKTEPCVVARPTGNCVPEDSRATGDFGQLDFGTDLCLRLFLAE